MEECCVQWAALEMGSTVSPRAANQAIVRSAWSSWSNSDASTLLKIKCYCLEGRVVSLMLRRAELALSVYLHTWLMPPTFATSASRTSAPTTAITPANCSGHASPNAVHALSQYQLLENSMRLNTREIQLKKRCKRGKTEASRYSTITNSPHATLK
ncbi:hypothetical protein CBL_12354 [Carabus blaptoides fortunei]